MNPASPTRRKPTPKAEKGALAQASRATSPPTPSREMHELGVLAEVSQTLGDAADLETTLHEILALLSKRMGMKRGTISVVNPTTNEAVIQVARGLSLEAKQRGVYKVGEGITGQVIATGRPMVVPKIGEEPLFVNKTRARDEFEGIAISFLCVPIKLEKQVIGAFSVDKLFTGENTFDEDLRFLTIIASIVSQAVRINQMIQAEKSELLTENIQLREQLKERYNISNIIGNSNKMHEVYQMVAQVAKSNASVLIRGESGTGKELVAHAIHYNSLRADQPFIKVNCAALPENLLESELFGHEKGSFTGALEKKLGRFELAHGGTIFLDEIGDLSPATQIKLLRVLQEKEFERVGGTATIKTNVRVMAATNKNLEKALQDGSFREDLYYRLNVFPIYLPPLRERKEDILLLAEHFAGKYAKENARKIKRLSTPAIDMLMSYHWPGNVRELENVIERGVLLCENGVIHGRHLPPSLQTAEATGTQTKHSFKQAIERYERDLIVDALKSARGSQSRAAQLLGSTERIIGYKIGKYKIHPKKYKLADPSKSLAT